MSLDTDKAKALESAIAQIERQCGKGSIMRMSSAAVADVPVISTGSLSVDIALGIGGVPRGRVVEVFGPEASGKTTLALHVAAEVQRAGGVAAFVDAEHALDPQYARRLGVDIDALLISQPDNGEQALEIVDMLVRSGAVDLVVVDSVAALTPKAELEGEMGDSHMGLHARLMSQALRKLTGSISRSQSVVLFINQIRFKIGIAYGNPEVTTGGNALKFYASVRMEIRRAKSITDKDQQVVGARCRVKVVKNKHAPPFRTVEFDINYGEGISLAGEVLDMAVEENLLEKSGAWFSLNGERIGQGRENVKQYLLDHPQALHGLEDRLRELSGLPPKRGVAGESRAFVSGMASPKTGKTKGGRSSSKPVYEADDMDGGDL